MMTLTRIIHCTVAVLMTTGLFTQAARAHEPTRLAHVLDFSDAANAEEKADGLFDALKAHEHQIVFLDLTINSEKGEDATEAGYQIETETEGDAAILCGIEGMLGLIDNVDKTVTVTTKHPAHHHANLTVLVGDRLRFPNQHIACSDAQYTEHALTALRIVGYYAVQWTGVPTAREFRLTPANPR